MQIGASTSETLLFPECIELLAAASDNGLIGRLAISTDRAPIVEPVTFDYEDRQIVVYPCSGPLADTAPGVLVAFEVDYVDTTALEGWTVLVRGLATSRTDTYQPRAPRDLPTVRGPDDPALVLIVRLDVVTGHRFALGSPGARN